MRKSSMKLSTRMVAGSAILSLVVLGMIFIFIYVIANNITYQSAITITLLEQDILAQDLEDWLEEAVHTIEVLGKTFNRIDRSQIEPALVGVYEGYDFIDFIWLATNDGAMYNNRSWTPPAHIIIPERPWWILATQPQNSGNIVTTLPYVSADGTYTVVTTVAQHLPNFHGVGGVLAMDISLAGLVDIIADIQADFDGQILLLGSNGEIIVHPDNNFMPTAQGLRNISEIPRYQNIFSQFSDGTKIVRDTNQYGVSSYFIADYIESTGWTLVAVVPTTVTSVPVWQTIAMSLIVVASALFAMALFAIVFISKQIKKTISVSVASFNERSVAMASGNITLGANHYMDNSFGLDAIGKEFNSKLDIIGSLILDLKRMNEEHMKGNFKYLANSDRYEGAYAKIVKDINEMLEMHTTSKIEILECITSIVNGDFNAKIRQFPGDERYINEAVEGLRTNVKAIADAVGEIADRAQQGRVEFALDVTQFEGEWRNLVIELNGIMTAIDKPFVELGKILRALQEGDFKQRVNVELDGEYARVKEWLNTTCDTVSSYIAEINAVLGRLAQGDLRHTITRPYVGMFDSIKESINSISSQLNDTMIDIEASCSQVLTSAEQIAQSSFVLADGATRQTSAIEELSNSLALIHEKASKSNTEATTASETTLRSQSDAEIGSQTVAALADTMHKVKLSNESVSKVINVISSIAFQTNLLALNASVEAARAGEHGKGFSVVADEVRTLAGRSSNSASETAEIIGQDAKNVDAGLKATDKVVESFETIANNIGEIAKLITHIADISHEQLDSIASINASVNEISTVVTNTSATAEESAAASQELNSQAELLKQKVAFFTLKK